VVDSCECGNEPQSSIKCGECSLFPPWSGTKDLSAPLYIQEPLVIGRRGCTGRDLNEKTLAEDNGR